MGAVPGDVQEVYVDKPPSLNAVSDHQSIAAPFRHSILLKLFRDGNVSGDDQVWSSSPGAEIWFLPNQESFSKIQQCGEDFTNQ